MYIGSSKQIALWALHISNVTSFFPGPVTANQQDTGGCGVFQRSDFGLRKGTPVTRFGGERLIHDHQPGGARWEGFLEGMIWVGETANFIFDRQRRHVWYELNIGIGQILIISGLPTFLEFPKNCNFQATLQEFISKLDRGMEHLSVDLSKDEVIEAIVTCDSEILKWVMFRIWSPMSGVV